MKAWKDLLITGKTVFACLTALLILTVFFTRCKEKSKEPLASSLNLFEYNRDMDIRWSSPENRNGERSAGAKTNNGAKGHSSDSIGAGKSYSLLDIQGQGIIHRIWVTIDNRSPEMLRSLKLEIFWDNETKPAVSVPFGDFFGVGLGKTTSFQNALFANPEGRSFICFIPMPFKKAARIVITNESSKKLGAIYFDVDFSFMKTWNNDYLYFHAFWQRETTTQPSVDFELLPHINGRGRFLGTNIGVAANPRYKGSWFGEGEVKMYIDDDKEYPTIVGTGTEDYIGTGWGQDRFINTYTGCSVADTSTLEYAFYRYHIPDPIYFRKEIRVVIQQIGGTSTPRVVDYQKSDIPLIPVTTSVSEGDGYNFHLLYTKDKVLKLDTFSMPQGWTNFYRSDDVSAVAYFYLNKPSDNLPLIQPVAVRVVNLHPNK
ncbi:MAG: glycoside hydrolase family 172 protein [Bacteroidota bacterium]